MSTEHGGRGSPGSPGKPGAPGKAGVPEQGALPFGQHKRESERQIAVRLVRDVLAAGCEISVDNGAAEDEEIALFRATDEHAVFAAMAQTDQDLLIVTRPAASVTGALSRHRYHRLGWICLVWGNDADVISDYATTIPEAMLAGALALASRLSGRMVKS